MNLTEPDCPCKYTVDTTNKTATDSVYECLYVM